MKNVSKQTNTYDRLLVYFEAHPNEEISVDRLSVVANTPEWHRQVRYLKPHHNMKVEYRSKSKKEGRQKDCYIYLKEGH